MKRGTPSSHYPNGQLGVSTKMTLFGLEESFFLGHQICEDMLNPMGHFIAEEVVMMAFKDKLKVLAGEIKSLEREKKIDKII